MGPDVFPFPHFSLGNAVETKRAEREETQQKLKSLAAAREKFVAEKSKSDESQCTLGRALSAAVREQAGKKGVQFNK